MTCWLVLDNASIHHTLAIAELVAAHGHTLKFLPPYSLMLNPIESLFSKWKSLIWSRDVVFTQQALLSNMQQARQCIAASDCEGWICEMNQNLILSLNNHIFD
jgi:hypothetical protein